jgi:hypothetical protein
MTDPRVDPEEALAEGCPTCQAKPGDLCVYEGDLFTTGPGKRLIHGRGEPLAGGALHNARKSIVKARVAEAREAWRAAHPGRRFTYTAAWGRQPTSRSQVPVEGAVTRDERIARLYRGGAGIPAIADMEGVSPGTVRTALHRQGVELGIETDWPERETS